MSNGLVTAIQQVDPFYKDNEKTSKITKTIYCHQFPAMVKLYDLNHPDYVKHGLPLYIGETLTGRTAGNNLVRFTDGDYSKCPEKVNLLATWEVHPDISDHNIREEMRKIGWSKKNPFDGSPEMRTNHSETSWSKAIHNIGELIKEMNEYYKSFEKSHGFSPLITKKKAKKKKDDMHRIPDRKVIYDLCERLKDLPKDVRIYIPEDAHGYFCNFLISMGFTNLFTDQAYKYFARDEFISHPQYITRITKHEFNKKSMRFDVIIGNPPYGSGGKLAISFLNTAGKKVNDNGKILLVLPKSMKGDSNMNMVDLDLHCISSEDVDPKCFPSGIDAVIQEWEVRDYNRKKIQVYTKHSDFQFLKYEERFEADVFIGEFGDGPCGKVLTSEFTHYAKGHNFIKAKPEIVERLVKLGEEGILRKVAKADTNGRGHCGKNKIIKAYMEKYEKE